MSLTVFSSQEVCERVRLSVRIVHLLQALFGESKRYAQIRLFVSNMVHEQ